MKFLGIALENIYSQDIVRIEDGRVTRATHGDFDELKDTFPAGINDFKTNIELQKLPE